MMAAEYRQKSTYLDLLHAINYIRAASISNSIPIRKWNQKKPTSTVYYVISVLGPVFHL